MLLGFKTELKLNNQQRKAFAQHCGVARHAWNWGLALTKQILDHNKTNPDAKIKFPSAIDLHKWLVALVKSEHDWYYEVSKSTPQQALMALRESWKRCFNKTAGVPKFKKKGRCDSFTLEGTVKILGNNKIQVPVIGVLKTYERLPFGFAVPYGGKPSCRAVSPQVQPKSVTISRQADRWFISFRFEAETQECTSDKVAGVDLGISCLAVVVSAGTHYRAKFIESPRAYKKYEAKLSRMQWLNRNKIIGSANWKKAQVKIARLHAHIANIRKDTLHKLTTMLAKNHSIIVIEDLNVSGMLANHKLAKSIADMGFYEFRRQLTYKCELYGSKLVIADRWFPSSKTCFRCRAKKETLSLKERVFECDHCKAIINRDLNAAINLAHYYSEAVS